jgi:hypothetical protein
MSWICSCGTRNVNVNAQCANSRCKKSGKDGTEIETYDSFDELLSDIRLHKIDKAINMYLRKDWRDHIMTPQEEKFSKLFNSTKILVKDMDTLTLRAFREELADIAFSARAQLTAVDDEEKERRKLANKDSKPKGFEKSLNTDEQTTTAINAVKERQKKMTRAEKIQAGLEKLGISSADASKLMSAGTILGRIKSKAAEPKVETESKPVFNPFAKKE